MRTLFVVLLLASLGHLLPAMAGAQVVFNGAQTSAPVEGGGDGIVANPFSTAPVSAQPKSVNFGSQPFGVATGVESLSFSVVKGTTVGSIAVLTLGAPNLDFTDAGGSTCAAATYLSAKTCTVNVHFTPLGTGLRLGAVVFFAAANNTGKILATVPLSGDGVAPQVAFVPSAATAIDPVVAGKGLSYPAGVAVDGAGNLYIADGQNKRVVRVPAGGGAATAIGPQVTGVGSLKFPFGVAVDGAGNLYIADYLSNRVVLVPAGGGNASVVFPVSTTSPLSYPTSVAVDGAGDLYIADAGDNHVVEVPFGGGTAIVLNPLNNGAPVLKIPEGVAVDAAGNLYISCHGNGTVVEIAAGSGSLSILSPSLGSSYSGFVGLAVDGAGNLFIADSFLNRIVDVPVSGDTEIAIRPAVNGLALAFPQNMALDGLGNLFIADYTNNRVVKVQLSQPPAVKFPTTTAVNGIDTTDGTTKVQVQNAGSQPLVFSALSYPPDFLDPGPDPNACTGSTSLLAGQWCDLPIQFAPISAGVISEPLTLTDNALNVPAPAYATQTITLSGTAQVPKNLPQTINFPNPGPVTYGVGSVTLGATATSKLSVTYKVLSGPAKVSGSTLTITGAGSVVVQASQPGNLDYAPAAPVSVAITVNQAVLTVQAVNVGKVYGASSPALTYTMGGFAAGDNAQNSTSGTPVLSTTAQDSSGVGAYLITIAVGTLTASNYTFAFVPGTFTVTKASLTVAATDVSIAYGQPIPKLTFTVSGFVNGDSSSVVGGAPAESTSAVKGSKPGSYKISIAPGTLTAANYSFVMENGTLTITP
jgi:sugar lactone lactonase YvrE